MDERVQYIQTDNDGNIVAEVFSTGPAPVHPNQMPVPFPFANLKNKKVEWGVGENGKRKGKLVDAPPREVSASPALDIASATRNVAAKQLNAWHRDDNNFKAYVIAAQRDWAALDLEEKIKLRAEFTGVAIKDLSKDN